MSKSSFIGLANEMAGRKSTARHQRRAAEALAKKKSIPAMKKIIRRNRQRQK